MNSGPRPTLSTTGLLSHAAELPWRDLRVVAATGSTNADLVAEATRGAPEGLVIAADEQTAGRGRLGRTWGSPPGASVSVSLLLRPVMSDAGLGWLPLLTGVAVAAGVAAESGIPAQLKWPNDVLVAGARPGKIAGVLVERTGDAAVVGFGINTAMTEEELPVAQASSIVLAGGRRPDPDALVAACLVQLFRRYQLLQASGGDAVRSGLVAEYTQACATIGRDVAVGLPEGSTFAGRAERIDDAGRLVVRLSSGSTRSVDAGDVTHVR